MPKTNDEISDKEIAAMKGGGSKAGDSTVQLRFVLYLFVACVPPVASIVLFSALGYGLEIHHWLLAHTVYSAYFGGGALFIAFILTAFDSGSWKGPFKSLKKWLTLLFLLSAGTSVVMLVRFHPWAPIAVFLTMMPAWFILIFRIESFLSNGADGLGASVIFMNRLKFPMGFAASLTIILWGAFLATDNAMFQVSSIQHPSGEIDPDLSSYSSVRHFVHFNPTRASSARQTTQRSRRRSTNTVQAKRTTLCAQETTTRTAQMQQKLISCSQVSLRNSRTSATLNSSCGSRQWSLGQLYWS
jgi:hypothetical protein